jgi:hypothetical protein
MNALPEPCRVLILSPNVPPYYLRKDYLKIRGMYGELPMEGVVEDVPTALASLSRLQITHVLDVSATELSGVSTNLGDRFLVPLPPPQQLELVFEKDHARVFRVISR